MWKAAKKKSRPRQRSKKFRSDDWIATKLLLFLHSDATKSWQALVKNDFGAHSVKFLCQYSCLSFVRYSNCQSYSGFQVAVGTGGLKRNKHFWSDTRDDTGHVKCCWLLLCWILTIFLWNTCDKKQKCSFQKCITFLKRKRRRKWQCLLQFLASETLLLSVLRSCDVTN